MQSRLIQRSGMLLAIAAAMTTACGSNSTGNNGDNNNGTPTCTVTLSGAQTGSPACTTGTALLDKSENLTALGFDGSGTPTVSAHVKIPGPAATGTYPASSSSIGIIDVTSGTSLWGTDGNFGTYTLTVTSVSQLSDGPTLTEYRTHGTLTATLPPISGAATGNVTMTITF
ncbi:MAG: hypothetical protein ACRELE_01985 [Gemmatimonadales bacterium]